MKLKITPDEITSLDQYHPVFSEADNCYRRHLRNLQRGFSLIRESEWEQPFHINQDGNIVYLSDNQQLSLTKSYYLACPHTQVHHHHLVADKKVRQSLKSWFFYYGLAKNRNLISELPKIMLHVIVSYLDLSRYCCLPVASIYNIAKLHRIETDLTRYMEAKYFHKYLSLLLARKKLPEPIYQMLLVIAERQTDHKISLTQLVNYLESGK